MKIRLIHLISMLLLLLAPGRSDAYHLFYVANGAGFVPVRWQTTGIVFTADIDGPVGEDFTALGTTALNTWDGIADALDVYGTPVTSAVDFTGANYSTAWGNLTGDGKYQLVYDADGSALMQLGLDPASINGYGPSRQRLVSGAGVIDDAFFIVNGTRADFDLLSTMVHELGHILGIAHSSVGMHNSSSPDTALDKVTLDSVPTMHPFSLPTGNIARRTPEPDDAAAMRELYPASGAISNWAAISGRVRRCSTDDVPILGANVRLVSTSNFNVQISRFTSFDGNSDGRYVMNFIPAGDYRVVVEPLGANGFTLDRFGTPPTSSENDFDFEYLSPTDVELSCAEETPEVPADIATVSATNGSTKLADDILVGGIDLAFVVDDTGSMGEEIDSVKFILNATITALQESLVLPFPNTAVVSFKDDVTKRIVSDNPDTLRAVVDGLFAEGGSDCPEASNAALLVAGGLLRKTA